MRGGQTTGVGPEARRNDWQIFQETGEDSLFGRADAVNMSMRPRDRLFETSVFRATGNSYSGDPFGLVDPTFSSRQGDQTTPEIRFGAYKRPIEKFADVARNVLFWESRFTQAIANTAEIAAADFDSPNQLPVRFGQIPQTIPGHHRKAGYFNVAFADGHASFVACRRSGDLDEPTDFRDGRLGWRVHWRASAWRYDSLPRRGTQSMAESRPFLAIGAAFAPLNDVRVINQPGAMSP